MSATAFKYNGKVQRPSVRTIKGLKLKAGTDYTVKWSDDSSKNAGKYTLTVTGKNSYTGTTQAAYRITKAANPLKVKGRIVKVKYKKLKKHKRILKASKVIKVRKKGQGKKTFKYVSARKGKKGYRKYFKISKKNGKVTIRKKLKRGTYIVKAKVRAAGNANYNSSSWKKVTIKVKVI